MSSTRLQTQVFLLRQCSPRKSPPGLKGPSCMEPHVPHIETDLNKLQAGWARAVLGCKRGPRLNWALSWVQCGWGRRLGTRMLEQAIMAQAQLWVLPGGHPAVVMREAARSSPAPSWWRRVGNILADLPGGPLPDIIDVAEFTDQIAGATADPGKRKALLKRYVVRPVLREYDPSVYQVAAARLLPSVGVPFSSFQPAADAASGAVWRSLEDVGSLYFRAVCGRYAGPAGAGRFRCSEARKHQ